MPQQAQPTDHLPFQNYLDMLDCEPQLCFQWLAYPVVDLSNFSRDSHRRYGDCLALTTGEIHWYRSHYLPELAQAKNPQASPLLAGALSCLPPAYILTAEVDVLRDEGALYAERLRQAGVAVEHVCVPGTVHSFLGMVGMVDAVDGALDRALEALRRGLRPFNIGML